MVFFVAVKYRCVFLLLLRMFVVLLSGMYRGVSCFVAFRVKLLSFLFFFVIGVVL